MNEVTCTQLFYGLFTASLPGLKNSSFLAYLLPAILLRFCSPDCMESSKSSLDLSFSYSSSELESSDNSTEAEQNTSGRVYPYKHELMARDSRGIVCG